MASLKRALELVEKEGAPTLEQLRAIHNQLGQALRQSGEAEEAAIHFAAGERMTAEGTVATREKWARQVAGTPDPEADARPGLPVIEASPLAELPPSERLELGGRVKAALARTYFNLGILQAQRGRFVVAGEQFEQAAGVDPEFPQVQSSLGIAYFNARQFDKATAPLGRALAATPTDAGVRRMLAMAWLNTREYEKAAELFGQDPEIGKDASLQFAYGLALAKSGRAPQAQEVFSRLLATHGDSTELSVLLGKAYAQMGDFDAAVEYLQKALRSRPDAAEANGALGVIFLKQGKMAEAEASLRAELDAEPDRSPVAAEPRVRARRGPEARGGAPAAARRPPGEARFRRGPLPPRQDPACAGVHRRGHRAPRGRGPARPRGGQQPLPARAGLHPGGSCRRGPAAVRNLTPDQGQALKAPSTLR